MSNKQTFEEKERREKYIKFVKCLNKYKLVQKDAVVGQKRLQYFTMSDFLKCLNKNIEEIKSCTPYFTWNDNSE